MKAKPPQGYLCYPDQSRKVAIVFPKDLFVELCRAVETENKTFSQIVVDRVKCGQLCLSESDALEVA